MNIKQTIITTIIFLVILPISVQAEPTQEEIEAILEKNNIATVTPETVPVELLKEKVVAPIATSTIKKFKDEVKELVPVVTSGAKLEEISAKKTELEKVGQELSGQITQLDQENKFKVFFLGHKKELLDSSERAIGRIKGNYEELKLLVENMPDGAMKVSQLADLADFSTSYQNIESKYNEFMKDFSLWSWVKGIFGNK